MPLTRLFAEGTSEPRPEHDVRGYPVRTLLDDERVGEVIDLLVDEGGTPRYLLIETAAGERAYPIGLAHAQRDARLAWVPGLSKGQLEALPPLDAAGGPERALSDAIDAVLRGGAGDGAAELARLDGLAPLSTLRDLKVAHGHQDPRGWSLVGAGGAPLGTVTELLADEPALEVVYLVGELAEGPVAERGVLVPVRDVRLDADNRRVLLPHAEAHALERLPAGAGATTAAPFLQALGAATGAGRPRPYGDRRYDPRIFFGSTD